MNNKQLAAARAVFNRFPKLRPDKANDSITPVVIGAGERGATVVITDAMSAAQVERSLSIACGALG